MEKDMIFINDIDTLNIYDSLNKLFLSFTLPEELENTLSNITNRYSILYNKIFILKSPETNEYICTYNIDTGNISEGFIPNTILVHRKKVYNVLYSINALNALIKSLNGGKLDKNYQIDWSEHQNSILLTNNIDQSLRKLNTEIHKVINC